MRSTSRRVAAVLVEALDVEVDVRAAAFFAGGMTGSP
jgi:hypothetical protein